MAEKKNIYPNPKFRNSEEEDKYWAMHSLIDEGYTAKEQKGKQKRSSFLTIRLTGEELTQLRRLAETKALGPSTFIRTVIKEILSSAGRSIQSPKYGVHQPMSIAGRYVHDRPVVNSGRESVRKGKRIATSKVKPIKKTKIPA